MYLNAAVTGETDLPARDLLDALLRIEGTSAASGPIPAPRARSISTSCFPATTWWTWTD